MVITLQQNEFVMLVSFYHILSEQRISDEIFKLINRSTFCIEKYMRLSANFHVGQIAKLCDVDKEFMKLDHKRKERFLDVENNSNQKEPKEEYNNGKGLLLKDEQGIMAAVKSRDEGKVKDILNKVFDTIYADGISRSGCTYLFNNLIILSISICKKYEISFDKVYPGSLSIMEHVNNMERLKDCKEFFLHLFHLIISKLHYYDLQEGFSVPVKNVIQSLNQQYMNPISLSDIAEQLDMNSSYLSFLFKSEVGIGFSEYLNDLRLSRAKELMDQGNMKLKKIIEESGFVNYPYFFSLFKKKYNMTPKEYQNNIK